MIGLFALALLAGWSLIRWFLVVMWKSLRPEGGKWPRRIHLLFGVMILGSWFGWSFWEVEGRKMYWDFRVWQMCQEDGGVTVYETVELPAELYNYYADRNWIIPDKTRLASSDKYYCEDYVFYYHKDDPQVTRKVSRIVRRGDGEILGEFVRYGRGGGGAARAVARIKFLLL